MLVDRLDALRLKHDELHKRIEVMEAERAPDAIVQRAKKEKLNVKDEIEFLMKQIEQNGE